LGVPLGGNNAERVPESLFSAMSTPAPAAQSEIGAASSPGPGWYGGFQGRAFGGGVTARPRMNAARSNPSCALKPWNFERISMDLLEKLKYFKSRPSLAWQSRQLTESGAGLIGEAMIAPKFQRFWPLAALPPAGAVHRVGSSWVKSPGGRTGLPPAIKLK